MLDAPRTGVMSALPKPADWAPPAQDPAAAPACWLYVFAVNMRATLDPAPDANALTSIGGKVLDDFPATRLAVRGHIVFVFRNGTALVCGAPDVMTGTRTVDELVSRLNEKGARVSLTDIRVATLCTRGAIGRRVDTRTMSDVFDGELDEDQHFEFTRPDPEVDDYEEFPGCSVTVRPDGEIGVASHNNDPKQAVQSFINAHHILEPLFVPLEGEPCAERGARRSRTPRRKELTPDERAVVEGMMQRLRPRSGPASASK